MINHLSRWQVIPVSLILLGLAFIPMPAQAHGGVRQITDQAVITLYQEPLSPLGGEKVKASFIFADKSDQRLKGLPVKVSLIDTFEGDDTKDKTLFTKNLVTDANGIITINYRFNKANYYDYEFQFKQGAQEQEAGFLVQVRSPQSNQTGQRLVYGLGITTLILAVSTIILFKRRRLPK